MKKDFGDGNFKRKEINRGQKRKKRKLRSLLKSWETLFLEFIFNLSFNKIKKNNFSTLTMASIFAAGGVT